MQDLMRKEAYLLSREFDNRSTLISASDGNKVIKTLTVQSRVNAVKQDEIKAAQFQERLEFGNSHSNETKTRFTKGCNGYDALNAGDVSNEIVTNPGGQARMM
ncbi:uncharacterized protein PHALS_13581 [Plasmopara halstedii]|uniref:Uncharacterized protein n=1 Tax=Plasmopara halstedii TaxID=4781 RepID=A0A0P1AQ05_PLAHL|nr:uncharacterized protein PHALS_13581 [Plasmopara halstedii]CEG43383.1 hypothetical protein PHALS_13581 [Plasmopara halstedii]|eukprot:XP_024579752.1 hypothetical protein PHALS_13581 [Plasmopara halstedii]